MEMVLLLLLGLSIGILSSLLGLGGNILIIPILPLITELNLKEVIATGIFTVFFITFVNVLAFYRKGLVNFKETIFLIIPTIVFSYLGSAYSKFLNDNVINYILISIMVSMVLKLNLITSKDHSNSQNKIRPLKRRLIFLFSGSFSGVLAGITGIGSGLILGPILYGLKLLEKKRVSPAINLLIATACFFASLNNLSFSHFDWPRSGLVHFDISIYILLPALISSIYGRRWNSSIEEALRKKILSFVIIILILKLLLYS